MSILVLDLHRQTTTAVRLEDDGSVSFEETRKTCPQTFVDWFAAQTPGTTVIAEPTGAVYPVLEMARQAGLRPIMASTWALGPLAMRRLKDDQQDALRLAQLERGGVLHKVWIPDPGTRELRQLVAHRAHLVDLRKSLKNRVRAVFQRNLVELPDNPFDYAPGLDALRGQRNRLPLVDQLVVDQDLTLVRVIAQQLEQLEGELAQRTPHRATLGWGNAQARHQLFHAALSACRTAGPLRAFYRELRQHKPPKVGLLAVARKFVTLAWHILHRRRPCRWENSSGRLAGRRSAYENGAQERNSSGGMGAFPRAARPR